MQQVTHRKMSFSYRFKTHHQNSLILQEKLRESEWRRSKLEIEFNELQQRTRIDQETDEMGYKRRYRDLLESEKNRTRRNEQLFAALKRLEMRISYLSETTQKYKALRSRYKSFSSQIHRGRGSNSEPIGVLEDKFSRNLQLNSSDSFIPMENPNNFHYESGNTKKYIEYSKDDKRNTTSEASTPFPLVRDHARNTLYNTDLENSTKIEETWKHKQQEYPRNSEQMQYTNQQPIGISHENHMDISFPESRNYISGNEDRFRRDEIEYSNNIRHQTSNNSKDLSLAEPKYNSVDIISDIDKYEMGKSFNQKNSATEHLDKITSEDNKLKMPQEILRKYQSVKGINEVNSSNPYEYVRENSPTSSSKCNENQYGFQKVHPWNPEEKREHTLDDVDNKTLQQFIVKERKIIEKKENPHSMTSTLTIDQQESIDQKVNVELKAPSQTQRFQTNEKIIKTAENVTDEPHRQNFQPEEERHHIVETEVATEKEKHQPTINEAKEEVIQDLEVCEPDIDSTKSGSEIITIPESVSIAPKMELLGSEAQREPIINEQNQEALNSFQPNQLQSQHEEINKSEVGELNENLSQMNLSDNIVLQQPVTDGSSVRNESSEENKVEGSEQSNDQDVSAECQRETSEIENLDSNQNLQQENLQTNPNPDNYESSEDSEMKKFMKRSHHNRQKHYVEPNQQNYTVDENGQMYDLNGQPVNYDPGLASGTGEQGQYDQVYEAAYNDTGEVVYDQNGQAYDQQYYQNDPNYAGYSEYPQQYDDQQQYVEYDQEDYDPAQQANYDETVQQGYDPNSQYQSYYAEVKYDHDPFYQENTQESVPNPQHEENEEPDKTNRLMDMLESDTENSSRQENKVTTESDFDFSTNN